MTSIVGKNDWSLRVDIIEIIIDGEHTHRQKRGRSEREDVSGGYLETWGKFL
jgi:hypothetical protein